MYERERQSKRVELPTPREGLVGRKPVFLLDVSLHGMRVAQEDKAALVVGQPRKVQFEWNGRKAMFTCELRWLRPQQRLGSGRFGRNIYHAGYQVVHGTAESYEILREILREYSSR